jgi:hypothetical protein
MEVRFKNFVTIRGSYTQQGLSNHITFRPIKSGATVPLKYKKTCWASSILQRINFDRVFFLLYFDLTADQFSSGSIQSYYHRG